MRIAAFNVENLFDRPIVFNLADEKKGSEIAAAAAEFNAIVNKPAYSDDDKTRLAEIIDLLKIARDRPPPPYVWFRRIRGQLWRKPKTGPLQIVAKGRADWLGWVELKTEPNNAESVMMTGRVIRDVDADILAVIEAEDRVALREFSSIVLQKVEGEPYKQIMLIDGNDDRGIDVGLLTKRDFTVGLMRSHVHDVFVVPPGEPEAGKIKQVYSRDCPEFEVTTPGDNRIWLLPNHFKSKYGGNDRPSQLKRQAQAERTAAIFRALVDAGEKFVAVLGDLNDNPASLDLLALLTAQGLRDVSLHPTFDTGEWKGKPGGTDKGAGTYGLGNDSDKIDYLLLSDALFDKVTAAGLFRKGAWPGSRPKRWPIYPELKEKIHVASDHHVIWADIDIA
jgi:hypothetical protein